MKSRFFATLVISVTITLVGDSNEAFVRGGVNGGGSRMSNEALRCSDRAHRISVVVDRR